MSRLSALSLVLALAIGPDAAAICGLWCTDEASATEFCDHGTADSPLMAAGNCCDDQVPAVAVQTAVRFDASTSNGVSAGSSVRMPFVDAAPLARSTHVSGSRSSVDARPQITVLRI